MKTYTLNDLYKIYLDTPNGSEYEDTPTFLLKLSEMEKKEEEQRDNEAYLAEAEANMDRGSEMDMLADSGGPGE